jgi:Rap1a immunity proteins
MLRPLAQIPLALTPFAALLAAGLSLSPPARAAAPISLRASNAGELADLCSPNPREPGADSKINFCHGFAQGALDATRRRAEELKKYCFPSNPPPRGVVLSEFANWVRSDPAHRSQPAVDGLFNFFGERFPCK